MVVNDYNYFVFFVVLQDFVGLVDFRMLVNQIVVCIVLDYFDWYVEFIFIVYVVVQSGYFWVVFNCIGLYKY